MSTRRYRHADETSPRQPVNPNGCFGSDAAISRSRLYFATRSGDEGVVGLTRTMRDHRGISRHAPNPKRLKGFGNGADLIDLDQGGVADTGREGPRDQVRGGDEMVIAYQLHAFAERVGELL